MGRLAQISQVSYGIVQYLGPYGPPFTSNQIRNIPCRQILVSRPSVFCAVVFLLETTSYFCFRLSLNSSFSPHFFSVAKVCLFLRVSKEKYDGIR